MQKFTKIEVSWMAVEFEKNGKGARTAVQGDI